MELGGESTRRFALCSVCLGMILLVPPLSLPLCLNIAWIPLLQPDYERRLTAYARLTPELWSGLTQRQALPVMLACLHDLRNPDDLALR